MTSQMLAATTMTIDGMSSLLIRQPWLCCDSNLAVYLVVDAVMIAILMQQ